MAVSYWMGAGNWIQVFCKCSLACNCWPTSPSSNKVFEKKNFFLRTIYFFILYLEVFTCFSVHCVHVVPVEASRGCEISGSYRTCQPPCGCWEWNLRPLEEQASILNHWSIFLAPTALIFLKRGNIFIRYSVLQRDIDLDTPHPPELPTYTRRQTSILAAKGAWSENEEPSGRGQRARDSPWPSKSAKNPVF